MKTRSLLLLAIFIAWSGDSSSIFAQHDNRRTRSKNSELSDNHKSSKTVSEFLRVTRDQQGNPKSLETCITRYRSRDRKLLVDLIGVVHVGESGYYRKLNHQFKQYDSLLYELVAPKGSEVPQPESQNRSSSPIHWLQGSMQRMLGLQSQLKHIDYRASNFVHADLSPKAMQKKMAERGDTAWSLGLRAFGEMMDQSNNASMKQTLGNDIQSFEDLFGLMSDPVRLKVMMANQFTTAEGLDAGLGKSLNQLLIKDRNEAAMKVLHSEINRGQKTLALFYGAAHMPDFEQRLITELDLEKTNQAWVEAWDLQSAPQTSQRGNGLGEMLFELMDSLD